MGRKKIELTDDQIKHVETLASLSLDYQEMAAILEMDRTTFQRIREEDPRVQMAMDSGRAKDHVRASRVIQNGIQNNSLDAAKFLLTHRHGWASKTESKVTIEGNTVADEQDIMKAIRKELEQDQERDE